jgi:hypothetical protein
VVEPGGKVVEWNKGMESWVAAVVVVDVRGDGNKVGGGGWVNWGM